MRTPIKISRLSTKNHENKCDFRQKNVKMNVKNVNFIKETREKHKYRQKIEITNAYRQKNVNTNSKHTNFIKKIH